MREIEQVTKITNDFICDSHGIIVTEYCKRAETWQNYRDNVEYKPAREFMDELMPEKLVKEQEMASQKDQKNTNDLDYVLGIVRLGVQYWEKLLVEGIKRAALTYSDRANLQQAIKLAGSGNIPCSPTGKVPARTMAMARSIYEVKDKLESLGIKL